jgi:hypothetical protein
VESGSRHADPCWFWDATYWPARVLFCAALQPVTVVPLPFLLDRRVKASQALGWRIAGGTVNTDVRSGVAYALPSGHYASWSGLVVRVWRMGVGLLTHAPWRWSAV